MSSGTLLQKVFDRHRVKVLPSGTQIFIDLHLVHEVTSPQAFQMLRERDLTVKYPERTFATVDHIVPTDDISRPFKSSKAEEMTAALEKNCKDFGITYFGPGHPNQGIVHVIAPELGLTQPGMTIACGDSHTSTHGAFGALAFGIGTTEISQVLATQTMLVKPLKVRRINVWGQLKKGVYAKDVILYIINKLGVKGGIGYAYEYHIPCLFMEGRMTVCNMSIEGGARCGYFNPDQTTIEYLRGRPGVPQGEAFEERAKQWLSFASDTDAKYDDIVEFRAEDIEPMVTYGINPEQSVDVGSNIPVNASNEALMHMKFVANQPMIGTKVDVVFIGSCTNGRFEDFMEAAKVLKGRKVADGIKAIVVPGSARVLKQMSDAGLVKIFEDSGCEVRSQGCSMCLAMNPDKLEGDQVSASSSNRNFIGRQGSPDGRTLLMSPAMAAAAALTGHIQDVRQLQPVA